MSRLEQRYRRMLLVLPRWYREEREEEMVAAFLADDRDALNHEYGWPGWGEFGSLIALSARTRWPGRTGSPRALLKGQVVRLVALIGLLLGSVDVLRRLVFLFIPGISPYPSSTDALRVLTAPSTYTEWRYVVDLGMSATVVVAFLALLWGARRTALVFTAVESVYFVANLVAFAAETDYGSQMMLMPILFGLIPGLCVFAGFHSDAPPVKARGWLVALAVLTVFKLVTAAIPWGFIANIALYLLAAVAYLTVHYRGLWRASPAWMLAVSVVISLSAIQSAVWLGDVVVEGKAELSLWLVYSVAEIVVLVLSVCWLVTVAGRQNRSPATAPSSLTVAE